MQNSKTKQSARGHGRPSKSAVPLAAPAEAVNGASHPPPAAGGGHNRPPVDPLEGKLCVRPNEAARIIGIKPALTWELIGTGKLRSTKVGNARLVFCDSIRELLGM